MGNKISLLLPVFAHLCYWICQSLDIFELQIEFSNQKNTQTGLSGRMTEILTSQVLRSPSRVGRLLWQIHIIACDRYISIILKHEYLPLVSISDFFISLLWSFYRVWHPNSVYYNCKVHRINKNSHFYLFIVKIH